MDFSFSDEQRSMADLAGQILVDNATDERLKSIERAGGPRFDRDLWTAMARTGLLGLAIPQEYGGAGLGFLEIALVIEQIGRTTAPIPFLETVVLGALPIAEFGTAEQKGRFLARVVKGETVLTAALVEADEGDSWPVTTGTMDGAGWRLDGEKICVPAGQMAECVLVPARTGESAVGVFLVDTKGAGVRIEDMATTSGQPEAVMKLNGVPVPSSDLLGSSAGGATIVGWIRLRAMAALAALALGVCKRALDLTADYTKTRKQFDQPIGMFQAVGQRIANAYIDTEGIRLTAWQAAWRISADLPAAAEVAVAKYWAAEAGQRVVHAAQHLHGGIGVDRDYPLHRCFLYAKQLELTLGGATAQLRTLGRIIAADPAGGGCEWGRVVVPE